MSVVTQFPPATSAEAIRWFRHKLHLETDCADVHSAQRAGEVDFVLLHVVGSEEAFARRHLPGAQHLPHSQITAERMAAWPADTLFVVYCAGPHFQDEHIWTSGGVSSGFDLTLALVEEDYGFSLARDIAQDFVMYLRRPGGQLQFSRYNLQQTATQGPINDLLAWLLENLTADLSVDKLAEKVAMSPRNFTRVFTRETGASPARYVAEARLAAARQRLEQTHETLDRIAEQTGFGSSINLRRLFEKQLNLTPGEYRQRFHCRKMA